MYMNVGREANEHLASYCNLQYVECMKEKKTQKLLRLRLPACLRSWPLGAEGRRPTSCGRCWCAVLVETSYHHHPRCFYCPGR